MDGRSRAARGGRTLSRDRVEALLTRIRAEVRTHGYDIVLVETRDGTAILMLTATSTPPESLGVGPATEPAPISLDDHLQRVEADLIRWALRVARGNKSKAAALLKMKRSTLGDRITRCGLRRRAGVR